VRAVDPWSAGICRGAQLLVVCSRRRRLPELAAQHPLDHFASPLVVQCVKLFLDADAGRDGDARRALAHLLDEDIRVLHVDEEWLFAMGLAADACVALEDEAAAIRFREALAPSAGHNLVAVPEVTYGAVDRCLGRLAGTLGEWDAADEHFAAALALNTRLGARPALAQTLRDQAGVWLRRGGARNVDRGRTQLQAAAEAFRATEMDEWARVAAAEARR
jgi:hypothetical protein